MNKVTRMELAEIIGKKTLNITDKDKLAKSIASYLSTEHRSVDLNSLTRDIMQYRLDHGIIEAVALSAHPLTPEVIKDIKAMLKEHYPHAKEVLVDSQIDESLVGGVRIELPREDLDLSIKSKLNLFKRLVAEEGVR
jgi:F0F1-type ATP synthase delta subunit